MGDFFLVVLFDETVIQRFLDAPGARIDRLVRARVKRLDGFDQDALQLGRGIKTVGDIKKRRQRAAAQKHRVLKMVKPVAQAA